jgi:general stress protein CsbA
VSDEPAIDPDERRLIYATVTARRLQQDSLVWQVPVLSLTAQAFLYTIALGPDSSSFARIVSAVISIVITVLSVTLMARHRQSEVTDAEWLTEYEATLPPAYRQHGRPFQERRDRQQTDRGAFTLLVLPWPAFRTWIVGLGIFGLISGFVIVATVVQPELFTR